MEFRRRAHGDERRRRVLMDEMRNGSGDDVAGDDVEPAGNPVASASRTYSEAALADKQPAITCLIPVRFWTMAVLFLAGLALIAGIESLYLHVYQYCSPRLRSTLMALDVRAPGSVAQWFSSLVLFVAGGYGVAIFHLRRHKLDDFRGRYRVWIAASCGLVVASLDVATGLHSALAVWLVAATGTPILGDGSIWWLLTVGVGFFLLGSRLLFELWESHSAVTSLVLAAIGYSMAAVINFGTISSLQDPWLRSLAYSSSLLIAHFSVLIAVLSYARFVYLDSQGRLRRKDPSAATAPKAKSETRAASGRKKAARTAKAGGEAERTAPPKVTRKATIRVDSAHKSPPRSDSQSGGDGELDGDGELAQEAAASKLSKAERRRQRKLMRRQKQVRGLSIDR